MPLPRSEFFAKESIDTPDNKKSLLPSSDASDGWLLFSSSTTIVSKTYLGDNSNMDTSPSIRRPLLSSKPKRLALKESRSIATSRELQERLSISDLSDPGLSNDPFSDSFSSDFSSDSDSSSDYHTYNNSSIDLWNSYFPEQPSDKTPSQRSPLYQIDASTHSPVPIHNATPPSFDHPKLKSPLRRSDATRRTIAPIYKAFPATPPKTTYTHNHTKYQSWPTRKESHPARRRANTTPISSTSHLALLPDTPSTPSSPSTIPPLEKSAFDDDEEDEKSAFWKAFHRRAGSCGDAGDGKRSLRIKKKLMGALRIGKDKSPS